MTAIEQCEGPQRVVTSGWETETAWGSSQPIQCGPAALTLNPLKQPSRSRLLACLHLHMHAAPLLLLIRIDMSHPLQYHGDP